MTTKRRDLSIIIALGIILGTLVASQARADIRVNARVRVPGGVIQVRGHGHDRAVGATGCRCITSRRTQRRELTRHDRRVAGRLARYTGTEKRKILRLRRLGYRWSEIGMWLEVPHRTVRAALDGDAWARYVKRHKRLGRNRLPVHPEPNRRHDIDDCDTRW